MALLFSAELRCAWAKLLSYALLGLSGMQLESFWLGWTVLGLVWRDRAMLDLSGMRWNRMGWARVGLPLLGWGSWGRGQLGSLGWV